MTDRGPRRLAEVIRGRERELQAFADFLDDVRAGPACLLFEGEVGIGKTTIWEEAVARGSTSARILVARPVEAEAKMGFAALTDLVEPVFDDIVSELPEPQRRALAVALMRVEPGANRLDHRAVAAATLSVLRALSATGPIVVAVDDLQWLDRPSERVLEFALRRLGDPPVGLLACGRVGNSAEVSFGVERAFGNCRRVRVGPLGREPLSRILEDHFPRSLSPRTLSRIDGLARGNPFYALELARSLSEGDGTAVLDVPNSLRRVVDRRVAELPDRAREALLLVAAAGGVGVDVLVSALSGRRSEWVEALEQAEASGIIMVEQSRVRFRHPLFAAAVYSSAAPAKRRQVHARLGRLVATAEEKARHLALGADGPSSDVADALAEAAERARRRGAPEAAAELAEHARALTPSDRTVERQRRSIQVAEYRFHAGELDGARAILLAVLGEESRGPQRADALRLLGEIRYLGDSFAEGINLLEEALKHVGHDRAVQASIELRLAFGTLATADYDGASRHARRALELAEEAGEPSLLAEALASVTGLDALVGRGVDKAKIARALRLEDPHRAVSFMMRPTRVAAYLEFYAGHLSACDRLLEELRRRIIDGGEETEVPFVDSYLIWSACWRGDLRAANLYAEESIDAADRTGSESLRSVTLGFAALPPAFAGDVTLVTSRADEAIRLASRTGRRLSVLWASWARAIVALAHDDPQAADAALRPLAAPFANQGVPEPIRAFFLPDEIAALIALGQLGEARRLLDAFHEAAHRLERRWALMMTDRCRALLLAAHGDLDEASAAANDALAACGDLELQFEVARTFLAAGQIERRRRKRGAAADRLRHAIELFEDAGADVWAERAHAELRRVGLRTSAPTELTTSERRVAELTASGLTNREVAAQLFISAKTVEANLARVYRKLNVRSRAELGAVLASRGTASPQT